MELMLRRGCFGKFPFVTLCVILMDLASVSAKGAVRLSFIKYVNPDGEGSNGHCCDGRSIFCFGACDHFFRLCLGESNGPSSMNSCPFGRATTSPISDANTINFGSSFPGHRNLFYFEFDRWPGSIKLKVEIEDYDDHANDYVDFLQTVVTMTPAFSERRASNRRVNINGRTRIAMNMAVYCHPNYFGENCDVFCVPRDDESGHYLCDAGTGRKTCLPGWEGVNCERNIQDCVNHACSNNSTCVDQHLGYRCQCAPGFTGRYCNIDVDECSTSPCHNSSTCMNTYGGYTCICDPFSTGRHCNELVNFCDQHPCPDYAACESLPPPNGYRCDCPTGWTGKHCEINVNECDVTLNVTTCMNNATCTDFTGGFNCTCLTGYEGNLCEIDIDDCLEEPCINNGTCHDLVNDVRCECSVGFSGKHCRLNIDECINVTCANGGTCVDLIGDFHCACQNGTSGRYCETNFDDCKNLQCKNGATCVDGLNYYQCNCENGFTGENCEEDVDECTKNPCLNGGQCTNTHGSFTCACAEGYTGDRCNEDMDECLQAPCKTNNKGVNQLQKSKQIPTTQKTSWLTDNWYLVVVASVVVAVIIVTVVLLRVRQKRQIMYVDDTAVQYWPNSSELPASFENAIYDVNYQPVNGNITTDQRRDYSPVPSDTLDCERT